MKTSLLSLLLPFCIFSSVLCAELRIGEGEYSLIPDITKVYKSAPMKEGEIALKMQGFFPKGYEKTDSRPAVLFFHGGGWHSGTPDQFYSQCRYLALRGIVAFSAEYRTIKKCRTSPRECVKDGKSALRWLRKNATELGINPEKIAIGGGSAGGHIASAVALCEGFETEGEDASVSTQPSALILYNPVFDNGPDGFAYGLVKEYWKEISPIDNVDAQTPPSLVILGTEDEFLPVATAERYRDLLKGHGIQCDLHIYQGKPHGFFNLWVSKSDLRKTMVQLDSFLTGLGFLEGDPLF